MLDETMSAIKIAEFAHEMNARFCELIGDQFTPWADTPQNIKDSIVDGVVFFINNPNATSADSHANWLKYKVAEGWDYGEVKDIENKVHPCMVEYSELPHLQRMKDAYFLTTVRGLLEHNVQKNIDRKNAV